MQLSDEYDVIVVGAGGSGLATALSAAQHGGRALVLEKQPATGGTTGIAVGSFTAASTRLQHVAGIVDDPFDHDTDAGKFATPDIEARNNLALRQFFLNEAAATLDWLESLGLSFFGPSPEPPNRVPRMHNVVPGAKAYIAALQLALVRLGGTVLISAEVTGLRREHGRVVGVHATVAGRPRQFLARRGVVLAAGDYANSADLIRDHKGPQFANIEGINPYAGGDGHRLAAQAGAQMVNMDVTYGPELRFVAPDRQAFARWLPAGPRMARVMAAVASALPAWLMRAYIKRLLVTWQHPENSLFDEGAILVSQFGERFTNERNWPQREIDVARQPGKVAYILLDGRLIERYSGWPHFISTAPDIAYAYTRDYLRLRPDVAIQGEELASLAEHRGIDVAKLRIALDGFNDYVAGKYRDPFGRTDDRHTLVSKPWMLLGPVKAYFTTTEGGALINQSLQVLDASGAPIPGLYAVGQNGLGGMILWGHGLHIAWALTSGRLCGREIMQ